MNLEGRLARVIFNVTALEKSIRRRHHLNLDSLNADWIEVVGDAFFEGYHTGLLYGNQPEKIKSKIDVIPNDLRGFAYEGVGTSLTLLDTIFRWQKHRLANFHDRFANGHSKTFFAGVGLAIARLNLPLRRNLKSFSSEQQTFIIDGYGFYFGAIKNQSLSLISPPSWMNSRQKELFFRGLGRSLWFISNGNFRDILALSQEINIHDKSMLWEGVGIACAYAGITSPEEIGAILSINKKYYHSLVAGATIAKEAREESQIPSNYTSLIHQAAIEMKEKSNLLDPLSHSEQIEVEHGAS